MEFKTVVCATCSKHYDDVITEDIQAEGCAAKVIKDKSYIAPGHGSNFDLLTLIWIVPIPVYLKEGNICDLCIADHRHLLRRPLIGWG